jgi:dihydrofolate reductase
MRNVRLFIASSLDCYIARKDGGIGWLFTDADYGYTRFYDPIDTILIGRKTFDQSLTFDEYPYKGKKVYVFTRKSKYNKNYQDDIEYTHINVPGFVRHLTQFKGKDIWLVGGGGQIISILLNAGLVDEIILSIHPIILGRGIPLLRNISSQVALKLEKSMSFESGIAQLYYKVLKDHTTSNKI